MGRFRYSDGRIADTHITDSLYDETNTLYTVEYSIESYGHPTNGWDDPGEGAEITIWEIRPAGMHGPNLDQEYPPIDLNSEEGIKISESLEAKICEMVFLDGPQDYYDD